jgi:hypothetical protein
MLTFCCVFWVPSGLFCCLVCGVLWPVKIKRGASFGGLCSGPTRESKKQNAEWITRAGCTRAQHKKELLARGAAFFGPPPPRLLCVWWPSFSHYFSISEVLPSPSLTESTFPRWLPCFPHDFPISEAVPENHFPSYWEDNFGGLTNC